MMSDAQFTVNEVTLPIKPSETASLEERITVNAHHDTLPARTSRPTRRAERMLHWGPDEYKLTELLAGGAS